MSNKRLNKTLQIKDGQLTGNQLAGDASGIGNLDCYDDVVFPGFFSDVLDGFLANGFIADNHDWTKQLAMPTAAEERGTALYTEAEFHSTQDAQDAKTKVQERLAKGLSVGLSIGFDMTAQGYKVFKCGADLLAYAKDNGYDMSLFDVDSITAHTGRCQGLLKCHELFEYSLATVPANRAATAAAVKTALLADALRDHRGKAQIVAASAVPTVRLKGQYLGDDIEAEITISAVSRLMDRLYYRVMYSNILGTYDWDYDEDTYQLVRPPLDEALAAIGGAIDEFKEIALTVIEAIMSGAEGAESTEDAVKAIKAMWGDPTTKTFGDRVYGDAAPTLRLKGLLGDDDVEGLVADHKAGRVLSQENRDKLSAHKDALADGVAMLDDLLTSTDPEGDDDGDEKSRLTPEQGKTLLGLRLRSIQRRSQKRTQIAS